MKLKTANGISVVYYEIKEKRYLSDDFETEFVAKQWPPKNAGMELILVDESFIRQQPKLTNLKRVYASKRRGVPDSALTEQVLVLFQNSDYLTAKELMDLTSITIGQVYQLVYFKLLSVDFNQAFEPDMMIWRGVNA